LFTLWNCLLWFTVYSIAWFVKKVFVMKWQMT